MTRLQQYHEGNLPDSLIEARAPQRLTRSAPGCRVRLCPSGTVWASWQHCNTDCAPGGWCKHRWPGEEAAAAWQVALAAALAAGALAAGSCVMHSFPACLTELHTSVRPTARACAASARQVRKRSCQSCGADLQPHGTCVRCGGLLARVGLRPPRHSWWRVCGRCGLAAAPHGQSRRQVRRVGDTIALSAPLVALGRLATGSAGRATARMRICARRPASLPTRGVAR